MAVVVSFLNSYFQPIKPQFKAEEGKFHSYAGDYLNNKKVADVYMKRLSAELYPTPGCRAGYYYHSKRLLDMGCVSKENELLKTNLECKKTSEVVKKMYTCMLLNREED